MIQEQPFIQKTKMLVDRIPIQKMLDLILIAMGIMFTAYFLYSWLLLPSWVHEEFVVTAPVYLLKPSESLFSNLPEYVFNLKLSEGGCYRPRLLSFFIQYLDTNLSFQLYKSYPQFGIKLPSSALSILATVAAFIWFWKSLFPKGGYGVALIGGASLLYYDVYMNTSFMVLRGGKFLTSAAGIFCITIFVRYCHREFSYNKFGSSIAISGILFLLATIDEQITALIFFIAVLTLIIRRIEKRDSQATVIFVIASVNYCLYFAFWGRWLFNTFTPGGIESERHPHQFSDIFDVNLTYISNSAEMLVSNMTFLGIPSIIFLAVLFFSLVRIYRQGEDLAYKMLICAAFVLFPFVLTSAMVASHPFIYKIHQLWYLLYLVFPVHVIIVAVAYSLQLANFKSDLFQNMLAVAFIIICITGIYKMDNAYQIACTTTSAGKTLAGYACGANPVFSFK